MNEYQETRRDACAGLDFCNNIVTTYGQMVQDNQSAPSDNLARDLIEYAQVNAPQFKEHLENIKISPSVGIVIGAEPELIKKLNRALGFWTWMKDNHMIDSLLPEEPPRKEAVTAIPPEPGAEISGEAILEYLRGLQEWLVEVSGDLWDDDNPIEVPPLGEKYLVGDFIQSFKIAHSLNEGVQLRMTWLQLASSGNHWDTVQVGAARANMIYKAMAIMQAIMYPDSPQLGHQGPFGGFIGSILGPFGG